VWFPNNEFIADDNGTVAFFPIEHFWNTAPAANYCINANPNFNTDPIP